MSLVEHLRRHPFVIRDEERIRTRAYFHSLNATRPLDAVANWLQAEREELLAYATTHLAQLAEPGTFELTYDPPISYVAKVDDAHHKLSVGSQGIKICALCESPVARFSTTAHLIGEAFGNRRLFTAEECDDCNHKSGRELENELSTMLLDDRVLGQLRTKGRGAAKTRFGNHVSSVGGSRKPGPLAINTHEGESSVEFRETGPDRATLTFPPRKLRPISALRAIGRMAFLALPRVSRVQVASVLRGWVRGEILIEPAHFWQFFYPRSFDTVGITVWQRRPGFNVPEVVAMFHAAHSLIVIAPSTDTSERVVLPSLPLQTPGGTLEGWASSAPSDAAVTSRTQYEFTGTAQMVLHRVTEPMPVIVALEFAERTIELQGTLTTPEPDCPWEVIRYDVSIDALAATLIAQTRNGGRTWNCELSMSASTSAMELTRDLAEMAPRGMSTTIREVSGRQIYPVSRGWLPRQPET